MNKDESREYEIRSKLDNFMSEVKVIKVLDEINKSLQDINRRQDTIERLSESEKLISKVENRVDNSLNQIQTSFDRIHDKIFNFNNIMIASYMVLGTFPSSAPILPLWTVIFPIANLIYLIYLDVSQMEIHRFASNEMKWTSKERGIYGKKIFRQTWCSLIAMGLSLGCLTYIVINLF